MEACKYLNSHIFRDPEDEEDLPELLPTEEDIKSPTAMLGESTDRLSQKLVRVVGSEFRRQVRGGPAVEHAKSRDTIISSFVEHHKL